MINQNSANIVLNKKLTYDKGSSGSNIALKNSPNETWKGAFNHLQTDLVQRLEKKRTLEETIKKEISDKQ